MDAMRVWGIAAMVIVVAVGCAATPDESEPPAARLRTTELAPPPFPSPDLRRQEVSFDDVPNWGQSDYLGALEAFTETCELFTPPDVRKDEFLPTPHAQWAAICRDAAELDAADMTQPQARAFFENTFTPHRLISPGGEEGLVTAYYEPIIDARPVRIGPFDEPILGRPADLVTQPSANGGPATVLQRLPNGRLRPYPDRAAIVASAADNILAWGRRSEVLFLQIQGSGRLQFPDGRIVRAAFDVSNGQPYVSVAKELMELGLLAPGVASNAGVKRWLEVAGPEAASAVMARNPRYIFFRLEEVGDGATAARGAAGIPLRPKVSVAVDHAHHEYGALLWLAPRGPGAPPSQLAVAQDTGAAIQGPLRGDLFWGVGEEMGAEASRIRHATDWYALLPRREG